MNYAVRYPRFWLTYFVFCVVMLVSNVVYEAVTSLGRVGVASLLGTVLGVLGMWPLYGYVRQTRYSPRWLWKVVFSIESFGVAASIALILFTAVSTLSVLGLAIAVAMTLLAGPSLLALHQYIYRSPHIWA